MNFDKIFIENVVIVFGFLLALNGVYTLYISIRPESKTYIVDPGEKPFEGGVVDLKLAKKGVRFIIYGFLFHALKLIV
jgi:hypothetical protein